MPSFDVDRIDATIRALRVMPPGALAPFAGPVAPSGFLLCDGSAVLRTTYAALFAAIGTTYGAGDGSTTFNVPDLRSRLPVGAGQGTGLTNRALAATGGEETHALTAAESGLPAHGHALTDPGHAHNFVAGFTAWSGGGGEGPSGGGNGRISPAIASARTGITIADAAAAAASQAHNTMPPFLAVNWIIAT